MRNSILIPRLGLWCFSEKNLIAPRRWHDRCACPGNCDNWKGVGPPNIDHSYCTPWNRLHLRFHCRCRCRTSVCSHVSFLGSCMRCRNHCPLWFWCCSILTLDKFVLLDATLCYHIVVHWLRVGRQHGDKVCLDQMLSRPACWVLIPFRHNRSCGTIRSHLRLHSASELGFANSTVRNCSFPGIVRMLWLHPLHSSLLLSTN